jgi:hypothetical protein
MTIKLQALSLVEKEEPVQVCFILRLRDQRSMWMQDACKVYMDSHIASNGSCFMVTWTIFQNHLLEVGLTQNHGTPNAHTHWFILCYHVRGRAWIEIHRNNIRSRAQSHVTSHYTWGSVTRLHEFGGVLGWPLHTFFWALTISRSQLLAHVWSGPILTLVHIHRCKRQFHKEASYKRTSLIYSFLI